MLSQTYSIVRANASFFGFIVCAMTAFFVFQDMYPDQKMGQANSFIPVLLAYVVSRLIVENKEKISGNMQGFWGFSVKSMVLVFALIALGIVAYLGLTDKGSGGIQVWMVGLMAIVYFAGMSLLGTWPVSSIGRVGTSLASALRRGRRRFFPTFGRMLLATLLAICLSLISMTGDVATSPAMFSDWGATAFVVALNAVAAIIYVLSTSYVAVVLARVYADDEKDALATQRTHLATA